MCFFIFNRKKTLNLHNVNSRSRFVLGFLGIGRGKDSPES